MMNPLRYFMVPLLVLAAFAGWLAVTRDQQWVWLLLIALMGVAAVYTLGPQIKWWYWQRRAPDLPGAFARLLETRFPFYMALTPDEKREFRRRVFLIREATDFSGVNMDKVPEDVEVMFAISQAMLTWGREDMLLPDFEVVVFYEHPFPSPERDELHATELHTGDGAYIFSLPHFVKSVIEPRAYPQLGLYEISRAYQLTYPGNEYPALDWPAFTRITGMEETAVKNFIGWPEPDLAALTMTLYFSHAPHLQKTAPAEFHHLTEALRINANHSRPDELTTTNQLTQPQSSNHAKT